MFGNVAGIPAVCFGPFAEAAHGVGERVYLPTVVQTAQVMGLFIRDWCGYPGAAWLAALVLLIIVARLLVRRTHDAAPPASRPRPDADASAHRDRALGPNADRAPLVGIPAIRNFFRTNETPVYFVSATAFNLLGIDRWVRNFRFVNYYDSFDGWHPNVFVPKEQSPRAFESIEEICNYLLGHKEVVDFIGGRGPAARRRS